MVFQPFRRASAGAPATVTVSPQTSYLTVQATLTTADSGSAPAVRMVEDSTNRDHRVLVLTGRVPRGAPSNPRWVIPSPSRFGEIVLAEALRAAGVSALPRLATRRAEPAALRGAYVDSLLVAEHVSLPLLAEARVLLKTSQNLHASNFPLLLAGLEAARDPSRDPSRTGFDIARELMVKSLVPFSISAINGWQFWASNFTSVGQNPDSFSAVRCAHIGSSKHSPCSIIPHFGQVTEDQSKSSSHKQR
jgi:D-alanyl-D-alanine carboxypeptidase